MEKKKISPTLNQGRVLKTDSKLKNNSKFVFQHFLSIMKVFILNLFI